MSVLPIVDLFILLGSGSVAVGFVLKAVAMTTIYRPTFLGFSSTDMLMIAGISFAMALVITARTLLKIHEPHLQELQRRLGEEGARRRAEAIRQELERGGAREAAASERAREAEVRAAATR